MVIRNVRIVGGRFPTSPPFLPPFRAEEINGPQWVQDVKQRLLRDALERMEAEKREGGDATANQECPTRFDPTIDGVDSDDSMDGFIVEDGESETEKDARRGAKLRKRVARKKKAKMRVDSEDEYAGSQAEEANDDDDDEIFEIKKGDCLARVGIAEPVRQPPMMAKFLPSTKMIAIMNLLEGILPLLH